jgi:uncharacterized phage protein (TIGR01671 family)
MRNIKFRAWHTEAKEWYLASNDNALTYYGFHIFGECTLLCTPRCDDLQYLEITQYTGLKDKNGKEIYEDDVVSFITEREEIKEFKSRVIFEDGAFVISEGKDYNDTFLCAMTETDSGIEVIGNIYENKELLEDV